MSNTKDLLSDECIDSFIAHIKDTHSFKVDLSVDWKMSESVNFLFPMAEYFEHNFGKEVQIDIRKIYGIALSSDEWLTVNMLTHLKKLFSAIRTVQANLKTDVLLDKSGMEFCARNSATQKIESVEYLNELVNNSAFLTKWKKAVAMLNTKYLRGNPHWYSRFRCLRGNPHWYSRFRCQINHYPL